MTKALKILALSILLNTAAFSRVSFPGPVPEDEWNALDAAMDREDWKEVETLASRCLAHFKGEDQSPAGFFRFTIIHAWAAQLREGKITQETLETRLKPLIGKMIITGHAPISSSTEVRIGCLQTAEGDDHYAYIALENKKPKAVTVMIDANLLLPLDTKTLDGKRAALCGTLTSFELCPQRQPSIVVTLQLEDAFIQMHPKDMKEDPHNNDSNKRSTPWK